MLVVGVSNAGVFCTNWRFPVLFLCLLIWMYVLVASSVLELSSVLILEGLSMCVALLFVSSVASDSVSASGLGSALASCAVDLGRADSLSSWMILISGLLLFSWPLL